MPNLFDGIRKMTDEQVKSEIALLSQVRLMNAAKETGNRMLGGLTEFANTFAQTLGRKTTLEYEVVRVSDMVRRAYAGLEGKDRIQLEYELKVQAASKCGITPEQMGEMSEERLAFLIVNEAAKSYSIQKYATPANKIEETSIQYNNAFLHCLHARLVRQSPEQVQACDKRIQQRLNEVSMENKRALQERLLPKEFSGRGIGRILRLERGIKYLTETVTYLGAECFDDIQTHVGTALSAVKNLKKVSWVLLAQLVNEAHSAYGGAFTVSRELLPSYIPADKLADYNETETQFRQLMKQRMEAEAQAAKCESALDKQDEIVAQAQERLELEMREYEELQMTFMGLQSRKDSYVQGHRTDSETKSYYNEVNDTKRRLDRAQAACEKQKKKLEELAARGIKLEEERSTAQLNAEVIRHKTQEQVSALAAEIMRQWKAYYYRFTFEEELFEHIATCYTAKERLNIEEMLKEIHDGKDVSAYQNSEHQIYCSIAAGKIAAITMEEFHVRKIDQK